ncbi:hypothetical protein [Peptostreptococcus stomatis]|jgi:hypothetical protein|uniref:hypothetical protein n=1 Tax=Peptostreptococcus stomatis TaxID=341694 RepID=UPI0024A90C21|nr:hypothetical protein [Peptostreptococcus stomatis]
MPRAKKTDVVDENLNNVNDEVDSVDNEKEVDPASESETELVKLVALTNIKSGDDYILVGETVELGQDEAEYLLRVGAVERA